MNYVITFSYMDCMSFSSFSFKNIPALSNGLHPCVFLNNVENLA